MLIYNPQMFWYLVKSIKQHIVGYPKKVMLSRDVAHRYGF